MAEEFPTLEVEPVVGDFERHLADLPRHPRRLVAFLGSTIGNLEPRQRARFLADARSTLAEGDAFLLGTDLVKSPQRLVAAYDDAEGVTADFDKNVLGVLNRELMADFDPDAFAHRAVWDADHEWIEMRLESTRRQRVSVAALDLVRGLRGGRAGAYRDLGQVPAGRRRVRAAGRRSRAGCVVDRSGRRLRALAVHACLSFLIIGRSWAGRGLVERRWPSQRR